MIHFHAKEKSEFATAFSHSVKEKKMTDSYVEE